MKTLTSDTSPIRVIKITDEAEAGGWVAITLAPGKKTRGTYVIWDRDLDADLARLEELGVTTLVPLLEDDELEWLEIPNYVAAAEMLGFTVRRYPFHDAGVPKDLAEAAAFVDEIVQRYRQGERVLMHCNGGLGRAGTMAACVRLAVGLDGVPEEAIASVRRLRSRRAIETAEQEKFVGRYYHLHENRSSRGGG